MIKPQHILLLFPALVLMTGCSEISPIQKQTPSVEVSGTPAAPFNDSDYANVLKAYVNSSGQVDYQKLQANRQQLDAFNAAVGAVSPAVYQSWSDNQKIAFLINAYNSFTLQSIVDQNPLKQSIRDIPGVWKIRRFGIAGESKTLDDIEHNTLRTQFQEPRIHAALVCAALSCPFLRNEPYTGDRLDAQLDDQVSKFVASGDRGFRIDRDQNRVYLSSIFKWYGKDFETAYGVPPQGFSGSSTERSVLSFISGYLTPEDRQYLIAGKYEVSYLDYDWSLNRQ